MLRMQLLLVLALVALALGGGGGNAPAGPHGSLRGALRALERRRRAPPGPPYPLASFQYPDRAAEFLSSREYQADDPSMILDPNERDQAIRKAIALGYFDKDEDYPSEDLGAHKATAFRERSGQLKHHKTIFEKKRSSPFRERGSKQSYQSDRLKEIFLNDLAEEEEKQREEAQLESDAEYVELLKELWDKYKYTHVDNPANETPEDLIRIYNKERNIRKRQIPGEYNPAGWGAVALKKKRSSQRLDESDTPNDFLYSLKFVSQSDPSAVENLKDDKVSDDDEDADVSKMMYNREPEQRFSPFEALPPNPSDMRDEYMLSLQPLNNPQSSEDLSEGESIYDYENSKEKRFPVSKRSGFAKPVFFNHQVLEKRNLRNDKRNVFRSSGTDPRVMKELSSLFEENSIFEDKNVAKKTVKRSNIADETSHETKPPTVAILSHPLSNDSHENHTHDSDHSHEHGQSHQHSNEHDHDHDNSNNHDEIHSRHEHENKPPLLRGNEDIGDHSHEHEDHKDLDEKSHLNLDHPIILKKKSIDWSNYFGIDKRKKKSVNTHVDLNYLRNLYLRNAKKHLNEQSPDNLQLLEEPLEEYINVGDRENSFEAKRKPKQIDQIKLDSMDNKLKNMESVIVDEALQYSGTYDGLDTKEEQEIKEKILSRLAAAYSLEKMRKALKEFKISLQAQRDAMKEKPIIEYDEDKEKRTSSDQNMKKKPLGNSNTEEVPKLVTENAKHHDKMDTEFESEQGAGHFLNGPIEPMSEGYMGGSGMKIKPHHNEGSEGGQCPILDRIVRRCHNVDTLAGDHGQLFLPLCSLHQICYLCGPSSPTGCDLIFVSEADSVCGGRAQCQQAARTALMALREEHDSLAEDLEGECGRDSCLYQAIENHSGWQHPFKR